MPTPISRSSSSSTFGDEFFVDTEKGSLLARNESSLKVESRKSNERPRAESSEMIQSKNDSRQATSIDSTATDRAAKKGRKVVFAASLYSFCSVSMVLTNKSLSSRFVTIYLFCANLCASINISLVALMCSSWLTSFPFEEEIFIILALQSDRCNSDFLKRRRLFFSCFVGRLSTTFHQLQPPFRR